MDLFDYKTDFDVEEFLDQSQEHQRTLLEDELEFIREQLEERETLHQENIKELQSKKDWYIDRLETLYQREIGKHGERNQLKQTIHGLYKAVREEKRKRWLDRQELEEEERQLLRELSELEADDILTDFL